MDNFPDNFRDGDVGDDADNDDENDDDSIGHDVEDASGGIERGPAAYRVWLNQTQPMSQEAPWARRIVVAYP